MRRIAIDTETHLVKPGMLCPKLVCVSTYDGITKNLYLAKEGLEVVLGFLADPDILLVFHNGPYDLGVLACEAIDLGYDSHKILSLIFAAYDANRIIDTQFRSMLVDIAQGSFQEIDGQRRGRHYALDILALRWCRRVIQKKDTWRLHYAYLQDTPLDQWPQEAYDYAITDAEVTWLVDKEICAWAVKEGMASGEIPDEHRQNKAAWVLHLIASWGVHVDSEMVKLVRENLEAQRTASYAIMETWGIFKKDKQGVYKRTKKGQICKDQKRLRALITEGFANRGESPPLTDGGKSGNKQVQTSADAARASMHPGALAYADVAGADKLLSTFVPILERGAGGMPITSNPNVMVASGRTSWTNPNWQNPPKLHGIRECIIARPGKVLVAADLDTVELRALAQCCLDLFGWSEMATALQAGKDLHVKLAGEILGMDYDTTNDLYLAGDSDAAEARNTAKQCNFGLGGGMGSEKFADTAISTGTPLIKDPNAPKSAHIAKAAQLKEIWFRAFPEMRLFLKNASEVTGDYGPRVVEQFWSGRIRGGLTYCQCANTFFQGLVADGTKLAMWRLAKACYVDKSSALYGSRIILFLHDEFILECPEGLEDPCATELVKILCGSVQEVIKDIPITSTGVAMRRWLKGVKPVRVNGKLVPSKPEKDSAGKIKWLADLN